MSERDEIDPNHELLAFAAQEVSMLLERQPGLTGQEVRQLLEEEAARTPVVPPPTTFHLVVDAGRPTVFCGQTPGPITAPGTVAGVSTNFSTSSRPGVRAVRCASWRPGRSWSGRAAVSDAGADR